MPSPFSFYRSLLFSVSVSLLYPNSTASSISFCLSLSPSQSVCLYLLSPVSPYTIESLCLSVCPLPRPTMASLNVCLSVYLSSPPAPPYTHGISLCLSVSSSPAPPYTMASLYVCLSLLLPVPPYTMASLYVCLSRCVSVSLCSDSAGVQLPD